MSVYKPNGKPFYLYDFQQRGIRFHGSTGCTTRREAERVEAEQRERAREALKVESGTEPLNLNQATARFWTETGQHYRGNYRETFDAALEWLVKELGADTLLRDIGKSQVAKAVARRRGEGVSNATVNRTVTEVLRRLLNAARRRWGQHVQEIEWKHHMLSEPKERIRELRTAEEEKIFAAMREDYHPILRFALMSGCRLAECVSLRHQDIDWGNRTITIHGKGDVVATIPLTSDLRELLWPLRGLHPEAVFTYVVAKARGRRRRGERMPITYEGLKTQWRRCKASASIEDFRFHDNRHTTATRLLRETGNLKLVQKLLRHSDIATTTKYAHASDDDLRQAMEAMEARQRQLENAPADGSETQSPDRIPTERRSKRK